MIVYWFVCPNIYLDVMYTVYVHDKLVGFCPGISLRIAYFAC